MTKLFYDHLIIIEEVVAYIDQQSFNHSERKKIIKQIDMLFHHHLLDEIFIHLPKQYHEEFIEKLASNPGSATLIQFLKDKTNRDIEIDILNRANIVKQEIKHILKITKKAGQNER